MIPRRSVVTGSVLGGILAAVGAPEAEAAPAAGAPLAADVTDQTMQRMAIAIDGLRTDLQQSRMFMELGAIRDAQKTFLKANGKFPDFIDIGVDVWYTVHDWHIRWQQPLQIGRDPQGRYTIVLDQTLLILHTESQAGYISLPYDGR